MLITEFDLTPLPPTSACVQTVDNRSAPAPDVFRSAASWNSSYSLRPLFDEAASVRPCKRRRAMIGGFTAAATSVCAVLVVAPYDERTADCRNWRLCGAVRAKTVKSPVESRIDPANPVE